MNKKDRINRGKFYILLTIIFVALTILILNVKYLNGKLSIVVIANFIRKNGVFSSSIYLLIFAIKPFFVIIPSNIIAVAAGKVFGAFWGFILTMIGYYISGTVAFFLSRLLGRSFVEDLIGSRFVKLDQNLEKNGFKILFLLRLPPILPYDALSYTWGLTKIKYSDFIWASVLGVAPETLCYVILGMNFNNPFSVKFILPLIIIIFGIIFTKKLVKR